MNWSPNLGTVWSHGPRPVPAGQTAFSETVPDQGKWDQCHPPAKRGWRGPVPIDLFNEKHPIKIRTESGPK